MLSSHSKYTTELIQYCDYEEESITELRSTLTFETGRSGRLSYYPASFNISNKRQSSMKLLHDFD